MGGYLRDGTWIAHAGWETDGEGGFQRQPSVFRERPGSAAPGRCRLYVSHACPWSHRTTAARALLRLESALPMTVVAPYMGEDGWAFRDENHTPSPEPEMQATLLRQLYLATDDAYSGRVTVPVLWDREEQRIVNNESRDILYILCEEFAPLASSPRDLYPREKRAWIDSTIDALYDSVNNGVYRCGFARSQSAYDQAVKDLFESLDYWNNELLSRRYLCGPDLTIADLCLFATLIRFDVVYHYHFKCNWWRIVDYSALRQYVRDLVQTPEIAKTCSFDHIKQHYYRSHETINPSGIIPLGPDLSWLSDPHDRSSPSHDRDARWSH